MDTVLTWSRQDWERKEAEQQRHLLDLAAVRRRDACATPTAPTAPVSLIKLEESSDDEWYRPTPPHGDPGQGSNRWYGDAGQSSQQAPPPEDAGHSSDDDDDEYTAFYHHFGMLIALATLAEENLRTILRVPVSGDTAEEVPDDEEEEERQRQPRRVPAPKLPALKPEPAARPPPSPDHQAPSARLKEAERERASSSLATTSSELENLRSSYQELETKLMEAEQKKEQAEKQLAEKNSELIREKGEFLLKRNADSETIKRQQKELNGLRKYMETAEHHWDLLAENILGSVTKNSTTRWFFLRTSPLKPNFKKSATRKPDLRNPELGYWTSSKDAPQEEPKSSAATSEEEEESEENVSSPAEGAKEKDPEGNASPFKAE
ncbi:hypothetical protein QYE76_024984 [Lolium multiflorum]|uniref:Uncharacterized protein n=1 Tax=Lolium multiflorum TaxID=4521 RepID=A0AAD8RG18_LOLMU|nr:hypothetical protein QYE76_024984 [Lolium multiflorum]